MQKVVYDKTQKLCMTKHKSCVWQNTKVVYDINKWELK